MTVTANSSTAATGQGGFNVDAAADQFLDATVNCLLGTDEKTVNEVLAEIEKRGLKDDFQKAVWSKMDASDRLHMQIATDEYFNPDTHNIEMAARSLVNHEQYGVSLSESNVVKAILFDEADSDVERLQYMDSYGEGEFSADGNELALMLEGAGNIVDFSDPGKLAVFAGVAAFVGVLAVVCPPAAGALMTAATVGGGVLTAVEVTHALYEIATTTDEHTKAEAYKHLGEGLVIGLATAAGGIPNLAHFLKSKTALTKIYSALMLAAEGIEMEALILRLQRAAHGIESLEKLVVTLERMHKLHAGGETVEYAAHLAMGEHDEATESHGAEAGHDAGYTAPSATAYRPAE